MVQDLLVHEILGLGSYQASPIVIDQLRTLVVQEETSAFVDLLERTFCGELTLFELI